MSPVTQQADRHGRRHGNNAARRWLEAIGSDQRILFTGRTRPDTCAMRGGRPLRSPQHHRRRHFFGATFVLSCLGFLFFLSFFCELLPLPMIRLLRWCGRMVRTDERKRTRIERRSSISDRSEALSVSTTRIMALDRPRGCSSEPLNAAAQLGQFIGSGRAHRRRAGRRCSRGRHRRFCPRGRGGSDRPSSSRRARPSAGHR
jgi:hypothetical protein